MKMKKKDSVDLFNIYYIKPDIVMIGGIDNRIIALIVIVVVAILGVLLVVPLGNQPGITDENRAIFACELLCKGAVDQGRDLSQGPCLSTELGDAWEPSSWACDIAHSPREPVDNQPENQCSEYGETATHFVEFTEDCEFIIAA